MSADPKAAIRFHIMETTQPGALDARPCNTLCTAVPRRSPMFNWAIAFSIIALSSAVFAFGGFDDQYASAARLLTPVFIALAGGCALLGRSRGRNE